MNTVKVVRETRTTHATPPTSTLLCSAIGYAHGNCQPTFSFLSMGTNKKGRLVLADGAISNILA